MKAAVMRRPGDPEELVYEEVPAPIPGAGQVLIEVEAIGLQGGDVNARASKVPETTPHIVGYQAAGVVAEADSDELSVGDRVVAFMSAGSHAERAVADLSTTWRMPDGVSFDEAATVPVEFGTAHDALFEFGELERGQTVLVQAGASGVGRAAIQLAKAAGATVFATASGEERAARLRDFGADQGIDYGREDPAEKVAELTTGRGVDLVIDPVGGRILSASLEAVGYRGRVVNLGSAGRDSAGPELLPLLLNNATLQGLFFGGEMQRDPGRVGRLIGDLLRRVEAGELRAHVDRVFPLADAAKAHRYVEERRAFGRVVLVP
jgi:NADPH:quinone reductase